MHRNTWPRANINISVMHCMGNPIKWWPMKRAMNPIKMKTGPKNKKREHQKKPDDIVWEQKTRRVTIRHSPKDYALHHWPLSDTTYQRPEDIIINLVTETKNSVICCRLPWIKLKSLILTFYIIKPKMQETRANYVRNKISKPYSNNPMKVKVFHKI